MKNGLFLFIFLLFSILTYSQTENTITIKVSNIITSKPLKALNFNHFDIKTLSVKHASYSISKRRKRFFKRQKNKQKPIKTLHKIIASIFNKNNVFEPCKLKRRLRFSSLKKTKAHKGFHLVESLYDIPTYKNAPIYKAPFMVSIKVLYGYLLETNNIHISSYPGIDILPYRLLQKQTFLDNTIKDLIIGFKLDIDFKL